MVASLFVHIAADNAHVYSIQAAMFQIYNEQIDDLLVDAVGKSGMNLQILVSCSLL